MWSRVTKPCPFVSAPALEPGDGVRRGPYPELRHSGVRLRVGVRLWIGASLADAVECGEVLVVGVREGVEVFLGGGDLSVSHAVHDGFEVGASGQEPGRVRMAEVVDADVEVDSRRCDGRLGFPS